MDARPTVEDNVLGELAEIVKIPPGKRSGFDRCIRAWVKELWRGMAAQGAPVRPAPILSELGEYQAAIQKVRELLLPNDGSFGEAAEHAKGQIWAYLSGMKKDRLAEFLDDGLRFLDDLDVAIGKAKPTIEKVFKVKGRGHGAQGGKIAIDQFLYEAIFTIREMGGKVATSRTQKSSPTHIDNALDILRPWLPAEFPKDARWACEKIGKRVNKDLSLTVPT